jgi:transglutaminase-like putative cysteine protease
MNRGRFLPPRAIYGVMGTFVAALGPHFSHLPWWVIGFVGGIMVWRWRLEKGSRPLPGSWTRSGLALFLLMGLLLDLSTIFGREAGTAFMIGLLAIKFLELRTAWDHRLVCFVCYFLVLGALLFSQTLLMCLYLLGVILVITAALIQVHGAADQPVWHQGRRALRFCLQAAPLTLLLFLFFPRFQGQLAFSLGQGKQGLSDSLQASGGGISQLISDDSVAFRAEFPKHDNPGPSQMYWRGLILWNTDGILWRRQNDGDRETRLVLTEAAKSSRPLVEQIVSVMPHQGVWAFALDHPVDAPRGMILRRGYTIESSSRLMSRKKTYTVFSDTSNPSSRLTVVSKNWGLQLPERVDSRLRALAENWRAQAKNPRDIPDQAMRYFRDEKFEYSTVPGAYGSNPVAEFMFERKKGFCEHYAGAMALLMRLAGVPSRVVVGYQGGEYNPLGDFWVIRQSSAHAWTEVWIEGQGWMRYDPTAVLAPDRLQEGIRALREQEIPSLAMSIGGQDIRIFRKDWEPAWLRQRRNDVGQQWDWLNEQWDRYVLSYDAELQQQLLLGAGLGRWGPWGQGLLVVTGGGLILAALSYVLLRSRRRLNPLEEGYAEYCASLAQAGVGREIWEGPLAYSRRASQKLLPVAEVVQALGEEYAGWRYGRRPGDRAEIVRWRRRVKGMKRQLHEK